jgi:hypothetical protein
LAIKAANEIDEVKSILNKTEAMRAYARQTKNIEMQNWTALIRIRAQYRLGELLLQTERNDGGRASSEEEPSLKTLKELGVTHKQSATCQKLASVLEATVDNILLSFAGQQKEITTVAVLRKAFPKTLLKRKLHCTLNCTITSKNIEDTRCLSMALHRLRYCQEKIYLLLALQNDPKLGQQARKVLEVYAQAFRDFAKFSSQGADYIKEKMI